MERLTSAYAAILDKVARFPVPSAYTHQLKPAFQPEKDVLETMMFHRILEGGSRCIIISLPILKRRKF